MPATTTLRRLLASFALICAGLSAQAATAPASIRVVLDDNYPPYSFRNAGGEPQGILKELWALWQQRTGIAVEFLPMDWAKARATMESGNADVIDTIFETEERRALYEFSAPYATIAVSLFFDESISGIADAQSAKGFTIGVKDGDACIDYLGKQGIGDLKRFASYEEQVRAAVRQDIRVLCIDNPPAYYFFNREGRIDGFRHSPPLYEGQFHWAVAKGRKDLQKLVAEGFARISAEERQAIERRWVGEKLEAGPWVRYARPLAYSLVALSLLIAALFAWSWTLRRQVAGRMSELSTTLASLQKSESRIRELLDEQHLIFDNAHVGILLLCNRQILKCNQRIAEMFGFATPGELQGQTTEIFYCSHEQFAYAGRKGYADLAKTGTSNLEFEMCRQDGKTIWVIQTGRPLNPDNVLEAPSIWVYTDITERKQAEIALRQSRQVFSSAFESCPIAASIASAEDGRFIQVNTNYERDFGWRKQELIGRSSLEIGLWPDEETRQAWVEAMRREGRLLDYETDWLNSRGERRCVSLSSEIIELDNRPCILAYVSDITARKRAEADLRIAAAAFESREAMMVTDADGVILQVNHAFSESTGYSASELIGQTPRLFKSGRHDDEFYRGLWQAIIDTGGWQGEIWDRRKNGEIYPKWLTISAVKDQAGKVTHYVGTHFDITERKKSEERIQALAFNDQLTGLANRFSLSEWLDRALATAGSSGRQLALMMIDLDNFKIINDTLGHQIGDQLLMEIAHRLKSSVRHTDLVARLGGDEFVVVLADIDTPEIAAQVADKILSLAALPCVVDGNELRTSTSIGICLYPDDATGSQDLIKKADAAMYHAKASGRGNYQFFKEEIQLAAVKRRTIENDLRKAIERREFLLHYQPQLDLRSGRLVGVEALVRWQHPEKGMVSPLDFIPIAEETGLILPIGDWVLEEACRQLALWRSRGIDGIRMSVNLTASQFLNRSLPDRILVLLRQYDLGTELINLEVTESMSMASPEQTIASMKELTDCGLSLAIDDFGTGYSSLSYLKLFPLSTLKIDRSFVKDIETDQNDACICDVTVLLAHKLGLDVVAEGVETEAQLKYLLSIGCEKIQGYLISKPLPADEAERFILSKPMIGGLGTADLWLPQEA